MKKLLALVLTLCMATSFVACGRGDTSGQNRGTAPSPERETLTPVDIPVPTEDASPVIRSEAVFLERTHVLPEGTTVKSVIAQGRYLALLWTEDDQEKLGLVPYSLDENGAPSLGQLREIAFTAPFEDCLCYALAAPGDGGFYLLCGDSREGAALNLAVLSFDSNGSLTGTMDIPKWDLQTVDCFSAGPDGVMLMATDHEARVYIWGQGLTSSLELEQRVQTAVLTSQGIAVIGPHEQLHTFVCNVLDVQTMELRELDIYSFSGADDPAIGSCLSNGAHIMSPSQGLHGELLVNCQGIICSLDLDAKVCKTILAWNTVSGFSDKYGQACRLSDTAFICIMNGKLVLTWQGTVEKRESGRLRVGVIELNAFGGIERELSYYSGAETPFTLDISTYSSDEAGLRKFQGELANGKFDLVVFSGEISTGNNEFEDLYAYLDSDPDLTREDFIPGLLDGLSTNGRLTEIWRGVKIFTMAGKESLVGDGRGLTVPDCQQIVQNNGNVQSILDNKLSSESSLRYDTLQNLAWVAACAFVDKNSAACSFDSQQFRNLLELCGTMTANPDSTGNDFLLNMVQVYDASALDYLTGTLGPCSYVGWPNGGDGIHYYSLDIADGKAMAIPSNSQNKAGAWGFIKYMLSDERQWDVASSRSSMPVIRSVVEEYNQQNFDDAQCQKLFSLLDRMAYVQTGADTTIREMIMETCQPYLAGDKSLEETVKNIQSRASLYMSEQYG